MIAITNAKVVLEQEILQNGVVLVEDDKIVSVGKADEISIPDNAEICDANGLYVGPGFVDIHVHGGGGHFLYKNPVQAAEHFLKHGETTILSAFYYDLSKEEFISYIKLVREEMKKDGAAKALAGIYMEGPYMNPKYGASPEKNKWRGEIKAEEYMPIVKEAGDLAKVWAVAPEREGIEAFVKDAVSENPNACISVGHSEATPSQVDALKKYGMALQTHCTNATGRLPVPSGTRGCGPDEACFLNDAMYAEVICDSEGIHVNPDMLKLILKIKGKDKVILISDSFVSDLPSPEELKHITDLCFDASGGLCGSNLTLDVACRNMIKHTGVSINDVFLMASRNPARIIKMDDEVGTIEEGKKANLVIIDDMFNVKKVMLKGKFC